MVCMVVGRDEASLTTIASCMLARNVVCRAKGEGREHVMFPRSDRAALRATARRLPRRKRGRSPEPSRSGCGHASQRAGGDFAEPRFCARQVRCALSFRSDKSSDRSTSPSASRRSSRVSSSPRSWRSSRPCRRSLTTRGRWKRSRSSGSSSLTRACWDMQILSWRSAGPLFYSVAAFLSGATLTSQETASKDLPHTDLVSPSW